MFTFTTGSVSAKRGWESKYDAPLGILPQLLSVVHKYCLVFLFHQILVRKIFVLSRKLCLFFDKQLFSPFINLDQYIGLVLLVLRNMGSVVFKL